MTRPRRLTMDLAPDDDRPPMPGDYVRSVRVTYLVVGSRPVESRQWPNRWALTLRRLAVGARPAPGARVVESVPYGPGERPQDVWPGG